MAAAASPATNGRDERFNRTANRTNGDLAWFGVAGWRSADQNDGSIFAQVLSAEAHHVGIAPKLVE